MISGFGIRTAMAVLVLPFLVMIPVAFWIGKTGQSHETGQKQNTLKNQSLVSILKNALSDRDYRLLVIGFATCGFNMSIIESHLFSQYLSYGIPGQIASLTLTVYGIATGAVLHRFHWRIG